MNGLMLGHFKSNNSLLLDGNPYNLLLSAKDQ